MRMCIKLTVLVALLTAMSWLSAQADVMSAAKQEGKVVWYSSLSLPIAQEVCNTYNAKKTGIECVLHRSGSGKLFRRWRQEAKSGIHAADVLHTSNIGHFVSLRKQGAIIQYKPEGVENYDANFVEADHYWHILRASVYTPAYNTKKLKASEVPRSWKDFLDPKWHGKMVHAHPSYSGFVSVGLSGLVREFGWEFMDKLAAQKPRSVQSAVDTTSYVVRGEALLTPGGALYNHFGAIKKGEPIETIFPTEGVPLITSAQAIFTQAPHPNAAKVFSDWLFSLEAQQILANRGLYSGHPGVRYPEGLKPLADIKLIIVTPAEAVKMRKPVRERFRKEFGV